jgi:hypothetical protein
MVSNLAVKLKNVTYPQTTVHFQLIRGWQPARTCVPP